MSQLRFFVLTAAGELLYPIKTEEITVPSALNHTHTIRTDMKPHLPTALRRALLAALAVAALAPAAWAETFTLTQDTSFKCGEGDWSLGVAFKSEITEVSYTFTSNPENKYSLSFSGGTDGVFCDYSGSGSFDYLTFTHLNGLSFSGNEAPSTAGVIRSSLGTITLTDNKGYITFSNNKSGLYGGAISMRSSSGDITLSKNSGAITFSGNTADAAGGAIYSEGAYITLSENTGAITFSGNEAKGTDDGDGGAIYAYYGMTIDNNGSVEFSGNKAQSWGGAICVDSNSDAITANENISILFSANRAGSSGGAIYGNVQFDNNTTVCFTKNSADNYGGAIYNSGRKIGISMRSNGEVTFFGNTAGSWGGAIHSNSTKQALSFVNNDSVLFQGNVANSADPTSIQLQGLFLRNTNGRGSFSAPEEGSITFYDSIYVVGTVDLNQSFDDDGDADTEAIAQTGTITFSGATAEDDLKAHLNANNMLLSEEQLANALAASLTSEIRGTTTLYAGTLEVVDGAVLTGGDKINSSGASVEDSYANGGLVLAEDSAATLYLRGGSIDKEVTLGETSQLKAEGENNNITALTVDEGASLTVSAYEQEGKPTVAGELTIADELVLNGTATVAEGATLTLGSSTTLASAISNDGTVALAGEITLNGFTKETVYTYSAGSNSGYRTTSEGYAVITGTGTTTGTATWKVGAAATNSYQDGYALFAGVTDSDNYWVGSGDTIALSKAQAEDATTIAMNGGTLTVDAAFDSVTSISSVVEGASGGTVEIVANHTLNKTVLTAAADKEITLTGGGTYNLGDSLDNGAGTGVVFGAEGTWAGTVSATDAELTSGSVDTTAWQRTELNGATTVNNGTTLTLGGDVTLKGQIANSGTLTLSGNITIDVESFAANAVTKLAPQTYQQGDSLASTTSGFATGGSIKIDLVTGNAADGSGANWTVGNYKEFSFDGNVLFGTIEQPGTEFFVNDAVIYQEENAIFTNANGQEATELVLNGNESVLTLESDLAQGLKIRADEDGTVVVAGDVTLNADAVSVQSGKEMSLTGDGTYTMSENANTLGSGVVLAEGDWEGTVVVNGAADALELGTLGISGSTIDLGGADHKLATGDHTVTAKVEGADSSLTMNGGTLTLSDTSTLKGVYGADAISATAATITNGLTVDSISGDVTVSGGMVQEKTSGEAVTVNGELTLGSVTLGAVLNNGGEIVFDGRMRVDSSAMGGPTSKTILYEDNDGTEGAHGFRKIETAYTVVTGAVDAVTDNASWTVDDAIPAIYAGGKVTTIGVIDSTTYWLNANSGDYALTTAQAKLEAGNYIALNGGTLLVDTALTEGVTISSTKDDATGGTVNMNEGTELSRSNLEAAEDRKITLTGSGAYLLEGNTDLGTGVELSDAWTGTVYTGKLDAGTALDAAKLGTDGSTLWLGNRPMRRNSGGAEVVLKNLTSANVGDTVAPGALTLQAGASTTQNLEVQGMLTLGTADSSASLTANGVVTLQGLTFGHADSTMQAEALGGVSTLDVQLAEELLGNKKSGTTLTLVTLTQEGFDGAALLNGLDATDGIRSTDNRREFTLDWNEDGTILTLTVRGTETYVTEQVKPTTHNGKAGVALLTDVFLNDTPDKGGALESLLDAVDAGKLSDRDAAAVAGASTAVLGQALSGDVERQLRAIRNRSISGAYGRDAVALNNGKVGAPSMTESNRYFAWVNAEGNHAEQNADGSAAGYTLSSWGGTVGAGMQVNNQLTLGLALTAMYGDLQSDGPDGLDGDMDTAYLSAFARYNSGKWSHAFIGTVGTMEADYKRTAMGYSNTGDTEGTSFGLMYELSRDYALSNNSSISPVFNISYRHIAVDGYSERGTDAALNVGEQSLDTVTVALGARYAAVLGQQTLNRACAFEARALAKYDFGDTQTDTNVGFINHATRAGIKSAELGAFGVELGAGISVPVGSGSIFADGAVELRSDYTNFNATVGYKIQF